MTISSQTSKAAFSGNGVSTAFPLPFPYLREADIKALLRQEGFETPLELGTHYTLSGAGSAQGGALVMNLPPATGQTLVVYRAPAIVQEVDYVENSAFPAETHEAALDLLTMICQSLQEQLGRAVLYPVSTPADDVLGSQAFLAATAQSRDAARSAEQNAGVSAGQAGLFASQAAASAASAEAVANTADGLVKISVGDAAARSLSSKLLAGNGLAEGIENPGGDEALRLAVALAEDSGLEFDAGLLRVKAGTGLVRGASGLAADAGTGAGQLVRLDANGRLPALDARNLTNLGADASARDNTAMTAFLAHLSAGRATGPVPGGGMYTLKTDELTNSGGTYDAAGDYYTSSGPVSGTKYALTTGMITLAGFTNNALVAELIDGFTAQVTTYPVTGGAIGTTHVTIITPTPQRLGKFRFYLAPGVCAPLKIQYTDDGTTWVDAGGVTTTMVGGWNEIAQPNIGAKYGWRVVNTAANPNGGYWNEIEAYMYAATSNMTLTSAAVSLGQAPTKSTVYLLHKSADVLTLNIDIKVSASRGGTFAEATDLTALCQYDADYKLLRATMDLSALPSGSSVEWRVQTFNTKAQRVRAALLWAE
ncbi:hypothetical protein [Humidesulfovibrio sp.]